MGKEEMVVAHAGDILHLSIISENVDVSDALVAWEFSLNGIEENMLDKEIISNSEIKIRLVKIGNWHIRVEGRDSESGKVIFSQEHWIGIEKRQDFVQLDVIDNMWVNRYDFIEGNGLSSSDEVHFEKNEITTKVSPKNITSQNKLSSRSGKSTKQNKTKRQISKSKSERPIPPKKVLVEKREYNGYTIQIAAVETSSEADSIRQLLTQEGLDVYLQKVEKTESKQEIIRIRVGQFPTKNEAKMASAAIEEIVGHPTWITPARQDF